MKSIELENSFQTKELDPSLDGRKVTAETSPALLERGKEKEGDFLKEVGVLEEKVWPEAKKYFKNWFESLHSTEKKELLSAFSTSASETKSSFVNTLSCTENDHLYAYWFEYLYKNMSEQIRKKFFGACESYLSQVPAESQAIYRQVATDIADFKISQKDIRKMLINRLREIIYDLLTRQDYGEYGDELYEEFIAEIKDIPAGEQLAVHFFKIIARILQEKYVDLANFSHFQQVVLQQVQKQSQSGIFNKTLERLGHLKVVPEIHWRVDRTSEEYNRRLGINLNGFLLGRAQGQAGKEVLLEIGPGSGVAKKERSELGVSDLYEDYALSNEIYFPLAQVLGKLIDYDKLERELGIKMDEKDRRLLADFLYKSFVIEKGQTEKDDFEYDDGLNLQLSYGINYLRYSIPRRQSKIALTEVVPQTISTRDSQGRVVYPYKLKVSEQSEEFQKAWRELQKDFPGSLVADWQTKDYYKLIDTFPPNTIIADISHIDRLNPNQVGVEIALRSTVYKRGEEYIKFLKDLHTVLKPGGVALDDSIRDNDGWYYRLGEVWEAKKSMPQETEVLVVLGKPFPGEDFRQGENAKVPLAVIMTKNESSNELVQKYLTPSSELVKLEDLVKRIDFIKGLDVTGRTYSELKKALNS